MFFKELETSGSVEQFDEDLFLGLVESIEVVIDKVMVRFSTTLRWKLKTKRD